MRNSVLFSLLLLILSPIQLFAQEAENLPPFIDLVYTYDGRGNVTSITDNIDSANNCIMEYDSLDRLITANGPWGKGTFTYDSQGNRTSKNIAGQIVSNTYTNNRMDGITHDANGNITNDGRLTYRYNSRNLITEVRSGDVLIESYKYDGLGRRIKRIDNAGKVTYYLYQGFTNRVLSELNGKGKPTVNYVYMGNTRVARVNLDNKGKEASREYYVPDHLGSNIAMTDPTSEVAWDKAYLPYGDTYDNLFPNQTENIHDYTGKELDEDTGLHYYGARYYNAKLGRFMSVDPVGGDIFDPQSFNKYPYVLNNPFKYVDPDGECPAGAGNFNPSAKLCMGGGGGGSGGGAGGYTNLGSAFRNMFQKALPPPPSRPALSSPTNVRQGRLFSIQNGQVLDLTSSGINNLINRSFQPGSQLQTRLRRPNLLKQLRVKDEEGFRNLIRETLTTGRVRFPGIQRRFPSISVFSPRTGVVVNINTETGVIVNTFRPSLNQASTFLSTTP